MSRSCNPDGAESSLDKHPPLVPRRRVSSLCGTAMRGGLVPTFRQRDRAAPRLRKGDHVKRRLAEALATEAGSPAPHSAQRPGVCLAGHELREGPSSSGKVGRMGATAI